MNPETGQSPSSEKDPAAAEPQRTDERKPYNPFPIVGVGASAGGVEAFTQLLSGLPDKTGMCFLFVLHLDPKHESKLTDVLSKYTRIPLLEGVQGLAVKPDHIYVIPPNTNMAV